MAEEKTRAAPHAPVLGIESSCDDTACAVLAADGRVLAERVVRQAEHAAHGGVVPEVAARAHLAVLPGLIPDLLDEAGVEARALGAIASTIGPGLIGGLIVGSFLGRGLATATGVRFLGINHLEAHALTARLPGIAPQGTALGFPYLLLLVSGGHCQCVAVHAVGRYVRLGTTLDDAAGEAFDKVAKLLGLPWPGGPALERLAASGDATKVALPRPLLGRPGCDFSFSGLKTAVRTRLDGEPEGALAGGLAADVAASFQAAVADVLADRARSALGMMGGTARALVAAGGVAANAAIRFRLAQVAADASLPLVAPPPALCTDNAVMVAWAAIERLRAGLDDTADLAPRPRWPIGLEGRA